MSIVELLRNNGPSLTSDLIEILVKNGVSNSAARQRLSRSNHEYTRLAGIRFEKNARFIYLEDQFGTNQYWVALEKAFNKMGKAYWGAINGLRGRGGVCLKSHFPIVCGAPVGRKRQLSPEKILERLEAIQFLIRETSFKDGDEIVRLNPFHEYKIDQGILNANLIAESVSLKGVHEYVRKLGLGSYGQFTLRDDEKPALVAGVQWDLSAPSYIRPLTSVKNGNFRPGFFVADLNLHENIDLNTVEVFIRKYIMASAPPGVAPIMPMLIGLAFTPDGFRRAKQAGIIAVTISFLFGEETSKALRDLIRLLADTGARAVADPQHIYDVMNKITKIEGAADRVRGSLFELVSGLLVKEIEKGFLTTGRRVTCYEMDAKAEIDVILDQAEDKRAIIIECKSKIPSTTVSKDELEHWYSNRVPIIAKALKQEPHYLDKDLHFELWSNGQFSEDANHFLKGLAKNHKDYTVDWKDGKALKEYAKNADNPTTRKILREHYFNHPYEKLAKKK